MERIAATLSVHTPDPDAWKIKFFNNIWKGWLSPATPVWLNVGTTRGLPVSCAGNDPQDNMYDIYHSKLETAMLTKNGFGTASYLGDIRPRGAKITGGGTASGVMPIITGIHADMDYVAQGTARRGSWAAYLPIDHGDFHEVCKYLEQNPDGNNVGWNISDSFIDHLSAGDEDAMDRYQEVMKTKMTTGKGYFWFTDKANDARPEWYKERGLEIKSSQLCSEIALHSDADHTFTCVLSSMNVDKYDEWKDTDAVFESIVFLDAVCQEFIEKAKNIKGLEKAVAFTKKSRALGLGAAGFSSYLYKNMIPYESLEAQFFDQRLFKNMRSEAERATKWLYEQWGAPEWCEGPRAL